MKSILESLASDDLRTIGSVDEVVSLVLGDESLFDELFQGLYSDEPGIRMRVADAIEKITLKRPGLIQSYKKELLGTISEIEQQEVQWHLAQIYPRLDLVDIEIKKVFHILIKFINKTNSNIVKVFSLQSMYDLAQKHPGFQNQVDELMDKMDVEDAPPSIKSRIRKLRS